MASRSYLVLASQRSGSTLLVESLRATGIAGNPEEFFQYLPTTSAAPQPREWFAEVTDPDVLALLDPLDPGTPATETSQEWRDRILQAGRSDNGVWGGKLMWNQTPLLVDRAAGLPGRSGSDLRSAIDDVLGDVLLVKVSRENVVDQAVSFWRAVQTRVWRGKADPERDAGAQYNADGIAHLVTELRNQEAGWRAWFADNDITPFEVGYEELTADTTKVVATILEALGLDPAAAPPPDLEKQGDARSNEWAERYRHDAATRGLPL
ncbi:MAG: sulfotransferase [Gordonia sp.]|uniref:Trehalose 2-sulfotransferase n=1 Tax=Gordonia rubripertincta TaxID=36822 RepID=A0ABT4MT58_GORRU|nr:Stf0 family sulfotransferase [Gordonia rubripertincta]MBA4024704.1 sulfotransferase [Gordonia sp. (in: high G+C Gram-positive bacteria)]MCZ4550157.1 Stf0 family sulfotransferase [Gordonia rubripertincta]